jgi:hypothetical protein
MIPNPLFVGIAIEMIDSPGIERRRTTLDAVYDVPLSQQQFRQIGAVLALRAGNECDFSTSLFHPW